MCNLNESVAKLAEFIEVNETLDASLVFPFWIKDKNFKFLRYNQAMVDLLYPGATLDSLLAKTDWEYAQSKKLPESTVNHIKNCCNLSDKDAMYSEDITNQYFEKVITMENDEFWLLSIKGRIPPKSKKGEGKGVIGMAIEFPSAELILKQNITETIKLSDNCYKLVNKKCKVNSSSRRY